MPDITPELCGRRSAGGIPVVCNHERGDHEDGPCTGTIYVDYDADLERIVQTVEGDPGRFAEGEPCGCPGFLGSDG